MANKKFPKRELFVAAIEAWKDRLWANDWLIDLRDDPDKLGKDGGDALAEIVPNYPYLRAVLNYDGSAMDSMEDGDIDTAALHEVFHLVSAPLVHLLAKVINAAVPRGPDEVYGEWLKDANEQVATHIERIARKGVKEWA